MRLLLYLAICILAQAVEEDHLKQCNIHQNKGLEFLSRSFVEYTITLESHDDIQNCLAATSETNIELRFCNSSSSKQVWLRSRYSSIVMNRFYNTCIGWSRHRSGSGFIALKECDVNSDGWECKVNKKCGTMLKRKDDDIILTRKPDGNEVLGFALGETDMCNSWKFTKIGGEHYNDDHDETDENNDHHENDDHEEIGESGEHREDDHEEAHEDDKHRDDDHEEAHEDDELRDDDHEEAHEDDEHRDDDRKETHENNKHRENDHGEIGESDEHRDDDHEEAHGDDEHRDDDHEETHESDERHDNHKETYESDEQHHDNDHVDTDETHHIIGHGHSSHKHVEGFCEIEAMPCLPPPSGLDSFLVAKYTAMTIIQDYGIDSLAVENVVGQKSCYEHMDTVVICCNPGFVSAVDGSSFKINVCLDSGIWSDPHPFYCVRKYCGRPPIMRNTIIIGDKFRFGDVVRYQCASGYKGNMATKLCGVDGKWVGNKPQCVPKCDYNITGVSGIIKSPGYPHPYEHMQDCIWYIQVPQGLQIAFWVRDFFLEPSSILTTTCHHDYFYIAETNKTRVYCGSGGPDGWVSKGNFVTVGFHSDNTQRYKGFKIEFTSWNKSLVAHPTEPARFGTFADEEDDTHVYLGFEYARYNLEIIYVICIVLGLGVIIGFVSHHYYKTASVHPFDSTHDLFNAEPPENTNRRLVVGLNSEPSAVSVILEETESQMEQEE